MYDSNWAERVFTLYCNSNPRARHILRDLLKIMGPVAKDMTEFDMGHIIIQSIARQRERWLWTEFKKACHDRDSVQKVHFLRLAERIRELLYRCVEEKAQIPMQFEM